MDDCSLAIRMQDILTLGEGNTRQYEQRHIKLILS